MSRLAALGGGLALLTAAGCIVHSRAAAPTATEAIHYPLRTLELDDGLAVVLEQAPDFGVAGAELIVGAGSADELAEKAGLAHLTEHLAFAARHGDVSFGERARDLDPNVNAATSWDDTTFFAFEQTAALEPTIRFLHGVVTEPLAGIDRVAFAREWHAVSNERRMRTEEGTPGQAEGWLMAATFPPDHPYAHSPSGTAETLMRLRLEDVRSFTTAHYRPERSTLVVSAPLSLDEQQALVERATGRTARVRTSLPARATPRQPPANAPRSFAVKQADLPSPSLWIGWSVPSAAGPKGDFAPLLANVARTTAGSALGDRDRDVAYLESGFWPGAAAGMFYVHVALKQGTHPEETARNVEDAVLGALGNLSARGANRHGDTPNGVLFANAAQFIGTDHVYGEESVRTRVDRMAWSQHHLGIPTHLRGRGERIAAVTWSDAHAYASDYFDRGRAHELFILPRTGPQAVEAEGAPPEVLLVARSVSPTPAPSLAPRANGGGMTPWRPALAGIETHTLANGLQVIVLPRHGSPFHTVVLGFGGGVAHAAPPGVLTALGWAKRWNAPSPRQFGIDYHSRVTDGGTLEELRATGSNVRLTLEHLRHMLGFSVFWPPLEFNKRVEVFDREDHAPAAALERRMDHATYGEQPLGRAPSAKEIQRITPAEVSRWVDRVRQPRNAVLVIVGDIEPGDALRAATDELGGWGAGARPAPLDDPPVTEELASEARQVLTQDRPGSQQATVRLRCVLPRTTADGLVARVIFADGVRRALLATFREQMGASSGVSGGVDTLPGGTAILDLHLDVEYASLGSVLHRLRSLLQSGSPLPGADAFEGIRRAAGDRFRFEASTTQQLANQIFWTWNEHWPLETLDRLADRAASTQPDDLLPIAAHCRENWIIGVLGDQRRVQDAVAASAR